MNFFKGISSKNICNKIYLDADRKDIWNEITNVMIAKFRFPIFLSILGIPKPLSAEVVKQGVGGYRVAYFSNNAQFKQEILEWNLYKNYMFSFNATGNFNVAYFMNLSNGPFEIKTGAYDLIETDSGIELILTSQYSLKGFKGKIMHFPYRIVVYYFQRHLLKGIRSNLKQYEQIKSY